MPIAREFYARLLRRRLEYARGRPLTEDGHAGRLYELTGPRLWTFAEAIAKIARATHRQVRYVEVSIEEYAVALESAQLPPEFVTLVTYLFTEVLSSPSRHS